MKKLLLLSLVIIGLSACASGVNRSSTSDNYQYTGQKFSAVKVSLNPDAQEKLKDNIKFDATKLEQVIVRSMQARQLIDAKSENVVNVLVTDIRTRSNFSAVMFGFMAGNDRVEGLVSLIPKTGGRSWLEFQVNASYALGGFGGGQDDARMNWLYEEFAKLTLNEILGINVSKK
jgi:hypothetical protein